jgi:hypothetical protein
METSTKVLIAVLVLLILALTGLLIWRWNYVKEPVVCDCPVCEKKKVSDYPLFNVAPKSPPYPSS